MKTTGVLPLELARSIWRCSRSVISALVGSSFSWAAGSTGDKSIPQDLTITARITHMGADRPARAAAAFRDSGQRAVSITRNRECCIEAQAALRLAGEKRPDRLHLVRATPVF